MAAFRAESNPGGERRVLDLLAQCDLGRGRPEAALAKIEAAAALGHPVFEHVDLLYADAQLQALRGRDDAALRSLARASELGFDDADRLEHDLAFAPLRTRRVPGHRQAARARALSPRERSDDPGQDGNRR